MFATGAARRNNALYFIHFGTVVLLFSMMLVVAYLRLAGFFEWVTELVVALLKPHHLLPTVIFISGFLSAFFVNDIICLVMVPFVLKISDRMGVKSIPYLLAVATASNIGSTATITGNPQNILIGSFSGIGYRDFLWHLGPVGLVGLFLDWFVLWWLYFRGRVHDVKTEASVSAAEIDHRALVKATLVAAVVLAGFLAGFPPSLVAVVGAAAMLITRTRDPSSGIRGSGLGPAGFVHRALSDRRRCGERRPDGSIAPFRSSLQSGTSGGLYTGDRDTIELGEQRS